MKNNNLIKLSLLACSVIAFSGCSSSDVEVKKEDPIVIETEDIKLSGLAVQRLTSGADSNNHPFQTFSYETVPVNSPYSDIDVTISFVNGTPCSNYVTTQHDASNKTITLTCLQPFNTVINLHLEAHYNSSVYADVTVRYLPKYTQDISKTLNFYKEDPQNPGNYIETTTTEAFLNAYSFDVSINTENVLINPRTGVQIDNGNVIPFVQRDTYRFPYIMGMYGTDSAGDFYEWINNTTGFFPNNFSSSFKTIMSATGFDVKLHELMIQVFVKNSVNLNAWFSDYSAFSTGERSFRYYLLRYLNSQSIDSDLSFNSTYTKSALINAINDWMENNDFYYMYFGHVELDYFRTDDDNNVFSTDIPILYGNSETDTFNGIASDVDEHTTYGYFKAAKFIMPEPFTTQELAPSSITVESGDIYF